MSMPHYPNPAHTYRFALVVFVLSWLLAPMAQADITNSHHSLPKLESIDQLGELRQTTPILHRFNTDNGIPVIAITTHELPMVDVTVAFTTGSAYDEQIRIGGQGIAAMTASMLTQGTKAEGETPAMSEDAFVAATERLGVLLSASAGRDSLSVHLRSLSDDAVLNEALGLFANLLARPAFDAQALSRNKSRVITNLRQNEQHPAYLGGVAFAQALFGAHPYAHASTGTVDSVATLSPADLHAFKDRYLVAANAHITITGDVSLERAKQIAAALAQTLPKGEPAPMIAAPAQPTATHIHIPHPSPQTHITIGHLSVPAATDEDSLQVVQTFLLANDVLAGGEFNAKLMQQIRVKDGYTYGIYGSRTALKFAGVYAISFATSNEVAKDAIGKTLAVIHDTQATGISASELALAKNNAKYSLPMRYASNASIHNLANSMNLLGLPDNYLSNQAHFIERTTLDAANESLSTMIRPQDFIIVTVGSDKPDLSDILNSPNL